MYCSDLCKAQVVGSHGRAQGYQGPPVERTCAECGTPFASRYLRQRFCSVLCRNRNVNRRLYRGVSNRAFPRVRYTARQAVFKREDGRCGICHAVINPALKFPHPGSFTIDHVDPHGSDAPENWQAAHNACNIEKGARRKQVAA